MLLMSSKQFSLYFSRSIGSKSNEVSLLYWLLMSSKRDSEFEKILERKSFCFMIAERIKAEMND